MADFNLIKGYNLATGAAIASAADVDALKQGGVQAIIDCQAERDDQPLLVASGLPYLWDPTADDGATKPTDWFKAAWDFAHPLLKQNRVVYAHCAAGVNRGPSMCYFLLRAYYGLPDAAAVAAIRASRPQVGLRYAADASRALVALHLLRMR